MSSLIQPDELAAVLPEATVLDVRYQLGRADGHEQYLAGHLPPPCTSTWGPTSRTRRRNRSTTADGTPARPRPVRGGDAAVRRQRRPAGRGLRRLVVDGGDPGVVAAHLPRAPGRAGARRWLVGVDPVRRGDRDRRCRTSYRATSGPTRGTCPSSTRRARRGSRARACCSTRGRPNGSGARSSRWTRSPATCPVPSACPPRRTSTTAASGRPDDLSADYAVTDGVAGGGGLLRLRGDRDPRPVRAAPARPARGALPGQLERLGERRHTTGRHRAVTPGRVAR